MEHTTPIGRSKTPPRPLREAFRIRMGRYPAEIAEGAEVYWEGGKGTYIGAVFNNCLGQLNRYH